MGTQPRVYIISTTTSGSLSGLKFGKIQCAQWNGTFRLHRPDPGHRAFSYCYCKLDAKEGYRRQQFCQMKRDISVRPTEMSGRVKVDHLDF